LIPYDRACPIKKELHMQYAHIQRSIYLHTQHLSILGFLMGLICTGITKNSKDFSINGLVEGIFVARKPSSIGMFQGVL